MTSSIQDLPAATQGRINYLRGTPLAAEGLEWLQRPILAPPAYESDPAADIQRGFDFLTTTVAFQRIQIPAGLLGPGMEPFDGVVRFVGAPLSGSVGTSDTVMERLEPATFGSTVKTQLVGFGNVTAEPVELRGTGELAGSYHIYVTLSPTVASYGRATYHADDETGMTGWVNSEISLAPLFELRRVDDGSSLFFDTGLTPLPNFPMGLTSDSSPWARRAPEGRGTSWPVGESLHYPEDVLIIAHNRTANVDVAEVKALLQNLAKLPPNHPDGVGSIGGVVPYLISACLKVT
jgi:hypothetical protein